MDRLAWHQAFSRIASESDSGHLDGVLYECAGLVTAEHESLTDAQIQEQIKGLRAILLARRQTRASVKYRKANPT